MKLFHISDLHLGCKLYNRDLGPDQRAVLEQILKACEREEPDALLIAGDVYDKAIPAAEAVELFDWFMTSLEERCPGTAILMIAGNHDSASRLDCYKTILARQRLFVEGKPPMAEGDRIRQVILEDAFGPVVFWLLPFVKPSMARPLVAQGEEASLSYEETYRRLLAREEMDPSLRHVLLAHQFFLPPGKNADEVERAQSEVTTVGNIDQISSALLSPFSYAALGHIHKPMTVGEERFRYCGTPLAYSVSEEGQEKGILEVELGPKGTPARITRIPLIPLRRVRTIRGEARQVLEQGCEDYCSVVVTEKGQELDMDLYEKVRRVYPNLLEFRREYTLSPAFEAGERQQKAGADPLSLCCALFPDLTEEEKEILADAIACVQARGGDR